MPNFLDYTNLTYDDIKSNLINKISEDPRFKSFREGPLYSQVVEIFSSMADLVNFNIERRAEENFLETSNLKSSTIVGAQSIGYVPARPIPAKTTLKFRLIRPIPTSFLGKTIQFRNRTRFLYEGVPLVINKTFNYTVTDADTTLTGFKDIEYTYLSTPVLNSLDFIPLSAANAIYAYQGQFTSAGVLAAENSTLGEKYQSYELTNTETLSNYYGNEDFGYDDDTGDVDYDLNFTNVTVGGVEYTVDRRSLINEKSLESLDAGQKYCVIKTLSDGSVKILFGDGNIAAKGPTTTTDDLILSYFSTFGLAGNRVGVVGKKLVCLDQIFSTDGQDATSYFEFYFTSNLIDGSDLESVESIKTNASSIFYSLDRCVTKRDYTSYLKSLTSPIDIKNAIAWGEAEESGTQISSPVPRPALANIALFTGIASLYDLTGTEYSVKPLSAVTLDGDFVESTSASPSYGYFSNVAALKDNGIDSDTGTVGIMKLRQSYTSGSDNVVAVKTKIRQRQQFDVENFYITPIIHNFKLSGNIYVNRLVDRSLVRNKINNAIYEFLEQRADFYVPIYLSNIIELVEGYKEVVNADLYFEPSEPTTAILTTATGVSGWSGWSAISATSGAAIAEIESTLNISASTILNYPLIVGVSAITSATTSTYEYYNYVITETYKAVKALGGYDTFLRDNFGGFIEMYRNTLYFDLGNAMLDGSSLVTLSSGKQLKSGNIANYSMRNEVVQVSAPTLDQFVYKT